MLAAILVLMLVIAIPMMSRGVGSFNTYPELNSTCFHADVDNIDTHRYPEDTRPQHYQHHEKGEN